LLIQIKLKGVIIREAEFPSRLIAELYELVQVRGHFLAHLLGSLVDLLALRAGSGRLEDPADLGIRFFLAIDPGAEGAEFLLDGVAQGGHFSQ
jgi:hypothetical protein